MDPATSHESSLEPPNPNNQSLIDKIHHHEAKETFPSLDITSVAEDGVPVQWFRLLSVLLKPVVGLFVDALVCDNA